MWENPDTLMLAEVATAATQIRWMTAARVLGDNVPDGWGDKVYGPPHTGDANPDTDSHVDKQADSDARALAGAAQIRAELGI
ncbi:MAG: hypothetical protein QM662_02450 [Gordonia sp. (in: high G+C Gram-positive bacteria)]